VRGPKAWYCGCGGARSTVCSVAAHQLMSHSATPFQRKAWRAAWEVQVARSDGGQ